MMTPLSLRLDERPFAKSTALRSGTGQESAPIPDGLAPDSICHSTQTDRYPERQHLLRGDAPFLSSEFRVLEGRSGAFPMKLVMEDVPKSAKKLRPAQLVVIRHITPVDPSKHRREDVRTVGCPHRLCLAEAGERCTGTKGPRDRNHIERVRAYVHGLAM